MKPSSEKSILPDKCWAVRMLLTIMLLPLGSWAQMTSVGVDCSQIPTLHIERQDNLRAGIILAECGLVPRAQSARSTRDADQEPSPPNILVSNRTCTDSNTCGKSESMVWHSSKSGDRTVVVNFNDSDGTQYSGTAYSTDDGATFTQIIPAPFATGHSRNYGDPIVVYNQRWNTWFAGDLVTGCSSFGIGLWSSPDGQNWSVGSCVHSGASDDRPSMWVDNNPFSRAYGRMYVSYNDYTVGGGALFVTYSDDGNNWSTPAQLTASFIRNVQLTGTPPGPPPPNAGYISTVFLAAMDEGGGLFNQRQNIFFRSSNGGLSWTQINVGQPFAPAGDTICFLPFVKINPIWRYQSWGQPAVGPHGVVHYAYGAKGALSGGDIYYTRSTDNGNTWSTPIVLNDPETNQYQSHWMPSVSVNYNLSAFTQPEGVTVFWYDRRNATTACNMTTDPGCQYQIYGIQSADNGATWGSNFAISSGLIPQPAASTVSNCYAGDYNYSTALGNTAFVTWTDGRVQVQGVNVQNVDFAGVPEP